jgi:hypothetical protein
MLTLLMTTRIRFNVWVYKRRKGKMRLTLAEGGVLHDCHD